MLANLANRPFRRCREDQKQAVAEATAMGFGILQVVWEEFSSPRLAGTTDEQVTSTAKEAAFEMLKEQEYYPLEALIGSRRNERNFLSTLANCMFNNPGDREDYSISEYLKGKTIQDMSHTCFDDAGNFTADKLGRMVLSSSADLKQRLSEYTDLAKSRAAVYNEANWQRLGRGVWKNTVVSTPKFHVHALACCIGLNICCA
jgi:hypothetical protein